MFSVLVRLWRRACALVKAISPCLPDLGTGPKIAPIPNAWGGFHEKTLLDVSGLRRGDFALRRRADERAGRREDAAPIPQLPFHLVENFFHYPANSVVGRVSGIAVGPTGNIVALNRGYHPVLEFKSDGTFVRSWGEGSTMFVGAHALRFDPQGNLWYVDAADNIIYRFDSEGRTVGTLGTNPEPWTWLTHVIEHAAPGRAAFYQETDIGWSKDGSMFVSDGYGNSRVAKFDKDGNFVKVLG